MNQHKFSCMANIFIIVYTSDTKSNNFSRINTQLFTEQ